MNSSSPQALILLLCALALLASGCRDQGAEGDSTLKVYRHAIDGAPSTLDPARASSTYSRLLVPALFDTLFRYRYLARPYELAPSLAVDFPQVSADGLIYEFRLRPDARFADHVVFPDGRGRLVTAADVAWSLARHFDPATRSGGEWLWRDRIVGLESGPVAAPPELSIAGLEVVDTTTLRIHLTRPFPALTHTLATAFSAVVPYEAVAALGSEFGTRPVGSGPFQLISLDETQAVMVANPSFRRGPVDLQAEGFDPDLHGGLGLEAIDGRDYPFIDRLEVQFIPEASARWTSFRAPDGPDTVMLPPEMADRLLASREPLRFEQEIQARYHSLAAPEMGFVYYGLNLDDPDIGPHPDPQRSEQNRALRCALGHALDWPQRNRLFHHGIGQLFPGVIPPQLPGWAGALDHDSLSHDPERARRMLAEAGWTAERLPVLVYGQESGLQHRQHYEQFRAEMMAIGWPPNRLERRVYPTFADYLRGIADGEVNVFLMGWSLAYPDAQYSLQLFYGPNASPGINSTRYRNPEFDRRFEQALASPDDEQRTALYQSLNRQIVDDCVILGSLARTRLHLWKRHVLMLPDRELNGGFFLRFVDIDSEREP